MTQPAPLPPDEQARLVDLYTLGLLDTDPEERFNHFIRHMRKQYRVPVAFISLVDVNRQWFKACEGLTLSETPRDISFCAHTILANQPMIIPDAQKDARFARNPLVTGPPFIRFYAGYPLHGPRGYAIGTLCMIDFAPRTMSEEEMTQFRELAELVEQEVNVTVERHKSVP